MKKILISQIADLHLQLRRVRVDGEVRRRVDDVVSSRSSSSSKCSCRHVNAQLGDGVAGGRVLEMWMLESGWSRGNSHIRGANIHTEGSKDPGQGCSCCCTAVQGSPDEFDRQHLSLLVFAIHHAHSHQLRMASERVELRCVVEARSTNAMNNILAASCLFAQWR